MTQKGNVLIYLLVGILVLAAIGGGYYLGIKKTTSPSQTQQTISQTPTTKPTPDTKPSTDETANWKNFTSKDYGYSIKYPSNLSVNSSDQDYFPNHPDLNPKLMVHYDQFIEYNEGEVVGNPSSIDIRVEAYPLGIDPKFLQVSEEGEDIVVDGIKTRRRYGLGKTIIAVGPIVKNNHQFILHNFKNLSGDPDLFYKMLSTFKFE